MDSLAPKEARFVEEYLIDLNAGAAAVRAGYSARHKYATGWDLLRKPEIQAAIQSAQKERSHRTGITQDRVLREIALLGFADLSEFARWGPDGMDVKDSEKLDPERRRAIVSVSQTQHGMTIKLADKLAALEKLCRHLGLYEESPDKTTRIVVEHVDESLNG
jgi:phage terminase small subunit